MINLIHSTFCTKFHSTESPPPLLLSWMHYGVCVDNTWVMNTYIYVQWLLLSRFALGFLCNVFCAACFINEVLFGEYLQIPPAALLWNSPDYYWLPFWKHFIFYDVCKNIFLVFKTLLYSLLFLLLGQSCQISKSLITFGFKILIWNFAWR